MTIFFDREEIMQQKRIAAYCTGLIFCIGLNASQGGGGGQPAGGNQPDYVRMALDTTARVGKATLLFTRDATVATGKAVVNTALIFASPVLGGIDKGLVEGIAAPISKLVATSLEAGLTDISDRGGEAITERFNSGVTWIQALLPADGLKLPYSNKKLTSGWSPELREKIKESKVIAENLKKRTEVLEGKMRQLQQGEVEYKINVVEDALLKLAEDTEDLISKNKATLERRAKTQAIEKEELTGEMTPDQKEANNLKKEISKHKDALDVNNKEYNAVLKEGKNPSSELLERIKMRELKILELETKLRELESKKILAENREKNALKTAAEEREQKRSEDPNQIYQKSREAKTKLADQQVTSLGIIARLKKDVQDQRNQWTGKK